MIFYKKTYKNAKFQFKIYFYNKKIFFYLIYFDLFIFLKFKLWL